MTSLNEYPKKKQTLNPEETDVGTVIKFTKFTCRRYVGRQLTRYIRSSPTTPTPFYL